MKTFFSEYTSDYTTYTFGYTYYAQAEDHSELDEIYSQWFLPYTGKLELSEDLFYFCRSLRVDISKFENNSENRRIIRKVESLDIQVIVHDKKDFNLSDPEFEEFCIGYTQSRFYHAGMTPERFRYVVNKNYANKIFEFRSEWKIIGYTLAVVTDKLMHHRFCFFDTELMETLPLGKYLMRYTIDRCKNNGLQYAYLGTCYKEGGLYKVRDFNAVEYWDGNKRSNNTEALKNLCKSDEEVKYKDHFKLESDYYLKP